MIRVSISPENVRSKEELHTLLAEKLSFPSYYGRNLDALYDMLTERTELTCIVIEDSAGLNAALGDYYRRFSRVLTAAQTDSNGHIRLLIK